MNLYGLGTQRTLTLVNGQRADHLQRRQPRASKSTSTPLRRNWSTGSRRCRWGRPHLRIGRDCRHDQHHLKRDFEGLETQLTCGLSDRGDGERYDVSVLFGRNFAGGRGNVTLSGSVDRQDGVLTLDRDYLARRISSP